MSTAEAHAKLASRAFRFIKNSGQWDSRALYRARAGSLTSWLTLDGIVYDVSIRSEKGRRGQAIHMALDGANPLNAVGVGEQRITTEFIAHKGARPIIAKSYDSVISRGAYPGIDVRTYMDAGRPRFDFNVAPGADTSKIKLRYDGASSVAVQGNEVVLGTQIGDLKNGSLKAYQVVNGRAIGVPAYFTLLAKNEVGVKVGAYDHSKPLVIDPLVYGSYYGGDDGFDEVRAVTSDASGGTYLTGSTQASQFPSTYGPYVNLVGGTDAFLTKFQGDAYSHDFACYLGGSLDDFGQYIQIDQWNNVYVCGRTYSTDFPGNTRHNIMFLQQTGGGLATGGTFILRYRTAQNQVVVPYNATPAQVQTALNTIPALAGHVISVTSVGGLNLPLDVYRIELDGSVPYPLSVISTRVTQGTTEISEGLPSIIVASQAATPPNASQILRRRGSVPDVLGNPIAQFTLTFTNASGSQTTVPLPGNASAAQIAAALTALSNIGSTNNVPNVSCTGGPINSAQVTVTFQGPLAGAQNLLVVDNSAMLPVPAYGVTKFSDVFVMRFMPDATTVLAPAETMMFGGDGEETLGGFALVANQPVQEQGDAAFVFAGDISKDAGTDLSGAFPGGTPGYLARYSYSQGAFTKVASSSFYIAPGPGATIDVTGVALDSVGAAYVGGTVYFQGNNDTSVGNNPPFVTTAGVFVDSEKNGRLLKNNDLFLRKYSADGTVMMYSCLIGGNNNDAAGGTNMDLEGNRVDTGSCVAVDGGGNAFITGISTSFNYPRTRGVFGETFNNNANVVVTKLNPDASQVIYSTNLKTNGDVRPAGIAVDGRGFAFVSGNAHPAVAFPATDPPTPADPSSNTPSSVQITADAIDPTYDLPAAPSLGTVEPWINVLNETATRLVYGSYLGGLIDDAVYAPYIDRFNDVWVSGWTDSLRLYFTVGGTLDVQTGALPDAMISPLAFKFSGDAVGQTGLGGVWFGNLAGPPFGPFTPVPYTMGMAFQRDGFLVKLRIGAAAVESLTFNPTTLAGGLGATTTGTVTLTDVAPPGGADVELDLTDTTAGSFSSDQTNPIATQVVTVPEGQTSVDFTFYSYAVPSNTQVQCKASYQGSYKIAQITVVPWLQTLALTPSSVVGGNNATGRVTLSQPAPSGGVTVDLITDSTTLIVLPQNSQVTIPEGQTSAVFTIGTHGVVQSTQTQITASLLGAGRSQTLTLTQAKIVSVSFNPTHVAGGGVATGTITLDGESGAPFDVTLTLNAGTAGYSITTGQGTFTDPTPATLTVAQGVKAATFKVNTAYETTSTNRKVTATRQAQNGYLLSSAQGTLFIDAVALSTFTISPNPVTGGLTATGTVQLASPAPAGGARVYLQSLNTAIATVPAAGYVDVPAGATSATFTIQTLAQTADATVTIRANRGPGAPNIDKVLSVQTSRFTITLNPTTVVGGLASSTGTIKFNAPPAAGTVVNMTSSDASAQVPATVTCNAQTTTFTISTSTVTQTKSVIIKGRVGPVGSTNTAQATLTVKPLGLVSIVLTPSSLRGTGTFSVKVTLDTAIGATPLNLTLNYGSYKNQVIANPSDTTLTIPAFQNQGTKANILTKRVSRTLATSISVTLNGKTVAATLTVKP